MLDLGAGGEGQQEVLRLQVAVDDAARPQRRHRRGKLAHQAPRLAVVQRRARGQVALEVGVAELGDEEGARGAGEHRVEPDDVRVHDRAQQADLAAQLQRERC